MELINKCIDKNFCGLLSHKSNRFKKLRKFLSTELNLKNEQADISNAIFLCCDDENDCLDFAANIMHALVELDIISEYTYTAEENDTPCIIDGFKENYCWEKIVNLAIVNKIVIFCANQRTLNNLKNHSNDSFYDIFTQEIFITPITLDNVLNSAYYMFDNLVENEGYTLEDDFYPALDEYINTIYDRASLKNKNFVLDLVYRVTQSNLEENQPKLLNANSIPFYIKRQETYEVEKEIRNTFSYSCCITDFLNYVSIANDIARLSLVNSPASFDAIVKANKYENIKNFVTLYADLLYSENYSVLPSNQVTYIEASELLRNNGSLEGKHGLYVIVQEDNLLSIEEFDQINNILTNYKKIYGNRIVWVLAALSLDEYVKDNIKRISPNLNQIFDLDDKDDESIRNFYDNYTSAKDIHIDENEYSRIYNSLVLSKNMQEAENYLDRIVTHYLSFEKDKIQLDYSTLDIQFEEEVDTIPSVEQETIECESITEENISIENETIADEVTSNKDTEQKEEKPTKPVVVDNTYEYSDILKDEEEVYNTCKDIPYNTSNLNILLLAMSTIPGIQRVCKYRFNEENIEGFYCGQLEPVPKMLTKKLGKNNQRIDYIFVLNSYKTEKSTVNIKTEDKSYTAFEYFKERCKCIFADETDKRIISLPIYKDENTENLEKALYNFHENIQKLNADKINVYLDIHGGLRSQSLITDAIALLIDNDDKFNLVNSYSQCDQDKSDYYFSEISDQMQIFNFVSGMKEFLNFGNSKSLSEFISKREANEDDHKLVENINAVSESIKLCDINNFKDNLENLNTTITQRKELENGNYFDIVIDMINNDYRDNNNVSLLEHYDLPTAISWCAKKELIQQALTYIESKTADYLVEKGILDFGTKEFNVGKKNNQTVTDFDLFNNWINLALLNNSSAKLNYKTQAYAKLNKNTFFKKSSSDFLTSDNIKKIADNNFSLNSINNLIKNYKNDNYRIEDKHYYYHSTAFNFKQPYENYYNYFSSPSNKDNNYFKIPYPIRNNLTDDFTTSLHHFLFMQKNLKFLRNELNHFNNKSKLSTEDVQKWIYVYLILLKDLESKVK